MLSTSFASGLLTIFQHLDAIPLITEKSAKRDEKRKEKNKKKGKETRIFANWFLIPAFIDSI